MRLPHHPSLTACAALVLAATMLGGAVSPALADLKLCNLTGSRVGVTIGYKDKEGWKSEGWWNLSQQACETIFVGNLPSRYYYVHAIDYDRGGEWSGPTLMCTTKEEFLIRGVTKCTERGYRQSGFFEVDTGDDKDWTVRLMDQASGTQDRQTSAGRAQ
ncbi:MAG: DUF1036 domain-containing protein [Pseudomonadota bacterium]